MTKEEQLKNALNIISMSNLSPEEKDNLYKDMLSTYMIGAKTEKDKMVNPNLPEYAQEIAKQKGVVISPNPRKDGRYHGYVVIDGQRKDFYNSDLHLVVDAIKKALADGKAKKKKKSTQDKDLSEYTLKEYMTYLFEIDKKRLSINTIDNYTNAFKHILKDEELVNMPMREIVTSRLQKFFNNMPCSRTRDVVKQRLFHIFDMALLDHVIDENPCSNGFRDKVKVNTAPEANVRALTIEEQQMVLEEIKGTQYDLIIRFLLATGLRPEEAFALTKEDFDFEKCFVRVERAIVKGIIKETKTRSGKRIVPVPRDICTEIEQLACDDRVFPVTQNAIKKYMQRLSKKLGVRITAYMFRHTFCTRLSQTNIPINTISGLMGHKNAGVTTKVYMSYQDDQMYAVADEVREAVLNQK